MDSPKKLPASSTSSGAALIIVIVLISMLMVLIIAFFSLTQIERKASRAYAQSVNTNVLADFAVNIVIAQIRDATTNLGTTETWASQPGMIRRYDNSGKLVGAYKLYSNRDMVAGSSFSPQNEVPPGDWESKPGLWDDLNEPAVFDDDSNGTPDRYSYPIVSPAILGSTSGSRPEIAGFQVENAPGARETREIPMPVQWLYQLQDGSLVPAGDATATTVTVPAATAKNPVVGRLAFWADDESCKVNINTASEGTFWDLPRTNSKFESGFSDSQPVQGEFQRYIGHPAMTCLSPILGAWLGDPDEQTSASRRVRILDTYYKLTPRVQAGGSQGGTAQVTQNTRPIDMRRDQDRLYATVDEYIFDATKFSGIRSDNSGLVSGSSRSNPRDIIEKTAFFLTAHSQAPEVNLFNQPRIALWPIQAKPTDRNTLDNLIAFCASTGTSTSGGTSSGRIPYYFQRATVHNLRAKEDASASSQSTTADWNIARNQQLYRYMQELMGRPIPGFGGKFKSKFQQDSDQILTEMVDYLRSGLNTYALNRNSSKSYAYAPPRKMQRSRGARGEAQVVPLVIKDTKGFGRFATVTEAALVIYPADDTTSWQPAKYESRSFRADTPAGNKKAFHTETVKAFMLLEFFCPSVGLPTWSPNMDIEIKGLDNFKIGSASLKMPSSATVTTYTPINMGPGGGHAIGGGNITAHFGLFQPLYMGDFASGRATPRDPNSRDAEKGYAFHSTGPVKIPGGIPPKDTPGTPLQLSSSGSITITLKSPATGEVVQTIEMAFPTATMPRPYIFAKNGTGTTADKLETDLKERFKTGAGSYHRTLIRPGDVVRSMEPDVKAAPKGDLRFYAAVKNVPREWFTAGGMTTARRSQVPRIRVNQYQDPNPKTGRFAHGLRQNNDWQFMGQFCAMQAKENSLDAIRGNYNDHPWFRMASMRTAGALVKGHHLYTEGQDTARSPATYRDAHFVCARDMEGAFRADRQPGDFDSGFGHIEDGCYINKPDEGNSYGRPFAFPGGNSNRLGGYNNRGHYDPDERGVNHIPNRQIASAVQMGSLPTGIKRNLPWQTLLFNPHPSGSRHPGATSPPDHLLLDWWWMPVAQPYPISQPMATSGKINLNYDILPFRYIKRRTPIHSLLKAVQIGAIPFEAASRRLMTTNYRQGVDAPLPYETRFRIEYEDLNKGTLRGFEDKFKRGEIFRSASEICEISLVPTKILRSKYWKSMDRRGSYSGMQRWWDSYGALTGDNMRETPYNHIYPRCTTKSNTFRVHLHVQRISSNSVDPTKIDLNRADISGNWRGSVLVERFVDPNDPELPDFASARDQALDDYYRFRILERREFRPQ